MEISQLGFAFVKPSPFAFVWRWQFQLQRQSNRAQGRGYFTAFIENKASLAQWEYWHWSECRSVVNNEYLLISVTAKINCFFFLHFTHSTLELKNQCIKICIDFTHAHKIGINNCIAKGFIVLTSPLYVHQIAFCVQQGRDPTPWQNNWSSPKRFWKELFYFCKTCASLLIAILVCLVVGVQRRERENKKEELNCIASQN